MCRGMQVCAELGERANWSSVAPLPLPDWIRGTFPLLHEAFGAAARGQIEVAVAVLGQFPDQAVNQWCVEHGQLSGRFRHRALGRPSPPLSDRGCGSRRPTRRLEVEVLERDHYQCRYCGVPVVPRELFVALGAVVGSDRFPTERENAKRHGARMAFGAQVDHVTPWSLGGQTTLENLVTSCWACNYGKARFHVDQIAITDPRDRGPSSEEWDGFTGLLVGLRAVAKRAARNPAV